MKTLLERLRARSILCKKLTPILPGELGSRKRIALYFGTDTHGYHCTVMHLAKKSRVLSKEGRELEALHAKMEGVYDTAITKKYVWIEAPLCSKAKKWLEAEGWEVL